MKKLTRITVKLMLLMLVAAATAVSAQAQIKLGWSVIGSGGVVGAQNGGIRMSATVGQPAVGRISDGKQVHTIGFWGGVAANGATGVDNPTPGNPAGNVLSNFPNPMTTTTAFHYQVPSASNVTLKVYDMVGRVVKVLVDEFQDAGEQKVEWNGKDEQDIDVSAGTYTYELVVSGGPGSVRYRQQLIVVR